MPIRVSDRLLSWAPDADGATVAQAARTAALPVIAGHVALMPDAHLGKGATIGSVIPTEGAIIPAAVGVDLGCGMAAVQTNLTASDLPDTLDPLLDKIATAIPAGVGTGHDRYRRSVDKWLDANRPRTQLDAKQAKTASGQLGTLGSGNHFVEVSIDEADGVWLVLHSGSRGIGNILAQGHIRTAKMVARREELGLEDPDLAYLMEGTPEFEHYIADLLWAQSYAAENREIMMTACADVFFAFVGAGREVNRIQCHHNYAQQEIHGGRKLWVTRKGAIRAGVGDQGIIPGSMGTSTFIVTGLGNSDSFESCSHGAGRRMSRNRARKELTAESLAASMDGKAWLSGKARSLVDEHPDAYKDIDAVMANQADLVRVDHRLTQVLNYKGT